MARCLRQIRPVLILPAGGESNSIWYWFSPRRHVYAKGWTKPIKMAIIWSSPTQQVRKNSSQGVSNRQPLRVFPTTPISSFHKAWLLCCIAVRPASAVKRSLGVYCVFNHPHIPDSVLSQTPQQLHCQLRVQTTPHKYCSVPSQPRLGTEYPSTRMHEQKKSKV